MKLKSIILLTSIVSTVVIESPSFAEERARPNVLMIAVDDLSDYPSILQNHPGIKTPNLDRLAQRGVNFTRAYCAAPLCQPSRAAVSSGMAPHQTGIYALSDLMTNSAPILAAVSLAEQFKRHGYDTYLTGKYYHAKEDHWWPADRLDAMWTERKPPFSDHGPVLKNGRPLIGHGKGILSVGVAPGGMDSMPDVAILENTRGWLAEKHDKPFFMVHGIAKPHLSFVAPQKFFDMYPLDSLVLPEVPEDDWSDIPASVKAKFRGGSFDQIRNMENGWEEAMQAYLACISFCDWVLGQILNELDASPYAQNTIVVLWSDHGYHIGEKERLHKSALWTQTSRMPFLISVPGMVTAGRSCAAPVSLLDIYPTLNELCRLDQKVPQALAGHSIAPLLSNPDRDWPYVTVTSHGIGNAAVTDARYHYIRYADGSEELYDDRQDPREYANLARQSELKPVIKHLSTFLPESWIPSSGKK